MVNWDMRPKLDIIEKNNLIVYTQYLTIQKIEKIKHMILHRWIKVRISC